jgi:hypothetical protein
MAPAWSPWSSIVGGIVFSFFLLTCAQVFGQETQQKFLKGESLSYLLKCNSGKSGAVAMPAEPLRDVNMNAFY